MIWQHRRCDANQAWRHGVVLQYSSLWHNWTAVELHDMSCIMIQMLGAYVKPVSADKEGPAGRMHKTQVWGMLIMIEQGTLQISCHS